MDKIFILFQIMLAVTTFAYGLHLVGLLWNQRQRAKQWKEIVDTTFHDLK